MNRKLTTAALLMAIICLITACACGSKKSSTADAEKAKTTASAKEDPADEGSSKDSAGKDASGSDKSDSSTHRHQWVYEHNYETVTKKVGTTLIVDQEAAEIPVKKKQYICNEDGYSFDTEAAFEDHCRQTGCDQGCHTEDVVVDVKQQEEVTHYEDITEKVTQDNGYWVCSVCGKKK